MESVWDRIGHTNLFAAAAVDFISLYRKRNDSTKRRYLQLLGRNVPESDEMILTLDYQGLKIEGSTYEVTMTEAQREIVDRLKTRRADLYDGSDRLPVRLESLAKQSVT